MVPSEWFRQLNGEYASTYTGEAAMERLRTLEQVLGWSQGQAVKVIYRGLGASAASAPLVIWFLQGLREKIGVGNSV